MKNIIKLMLITALLSIMVYPVIPSSVVRADGGSRQILVGGHSDPLNNTTDEYNSLQGGKTWSVVQQTYPVPASGTFSRLSVKLSDVPGTNGYTFTLMVNGSPTTLTTTVDPAGTTAIDTLNTVDVSAGDVVCLRQSASSNPDNTPYARWSIQFESDNPNESIYMGYYGGTSNASIMYGSIAGQQVGVTSPTESSVYNVIPTDGYFKDLYVRLVADPGTDPDAYNYTLRVNGADSDNGSGDPLQVTITADDTTGNDTTHVIDISSGDLVDIAVEPLNGPSSAAGIYWSIVFESDIEGESLILDSSAFSPSNSSTEYNYTMGTVTDWVATELLQGGQDPTGDMTLRKLYIWQGGSPGAGKNYTYTIRGGGGSTDLTVQISDAETTGSDLVHTYIVTSFDDLSIMSVPSGTPIANKLAWGLVSYTPVTVPVTFSEPESNTITGGLATITGNITDLGTSVDTTVTAYWGTTDGGETTENWTDSSTVDTPSQPMGVGAFSESLVDLLADTTYYFKFRATDGTWSSTANFTTQALTIPVVTADEITEYGDTWALLEGNITDTGGENCSAWGFYWKEETEPYFTNTYQYSGSQGVGAFSYNATGLIPATVYVFETFATNTEGTGYSGNVTFDPNPYISSVSALPVTCYTVTGTANITSVGGSPVTSWGYEFGVGDFSDNITSEGDFVKGVYQVEITITQDGVEYQCRPFVTNGDNTTYGDTLYFTTSATTDPTVVTDGATLITATSARLNATLSDLTCDNVSSVLYQWGTEPGVYTDNYTDDSGYSNGAVYYSISGLENDQDYYYKVSAQISGGEYQAGSEESFTTLEAVAGASQSSDWSGGAIAIGIILFIIYFVPELYDYFKGENNKI